mgnify:CR=1 FL=1
MTTYHQAHRDSYLEGLNNLYEEWIQNFTLAPVLTVPGDRFDFVDDNAAFQTIASTIRKRLEDKQSLLFPYEM